jgi:hypothetical protein
MSKHASKDVTFGAKRVEQLSRKAHLRRRRYESVSKRKKIRRRRDVIIQSHSRQKQRRAYLVTAAAKSLTKIDRFKKVMQIEYFYFSFVLAAFYPHLNAPNSRHQQQRRRRLLRRDNQNKSCIETIDVQLLSGAEIDAVRSASLIAAKFLKKLSLFNFETFLFEM